MEDHHLLPIVKDLLQSIGLHKKDISGLEDTKYHSSKNQKTENLSTFYVDPDPNNQPIQVQSSDLKALNLSPRFTAFTAKKIDKYIPLSKLNGRSVRKVKHDNTNNNCTVDVKVRRYKKINKIFGCGIDELPCVNACLQDGTVVFIPEVIYDLSSVILRDVSTEGIFRKAGSAQRQNNAKDIINNGQPLPDFLQATDSACLLKFFLRQLPSPLLSSNVLLVMSKCLALPTEKMEDGLVLTFLAIPKHQRNVLLYILEVLNIVASSKNSNLMDASSLAIVLAPNFLSSIFRRQRKGWTFSANEKDDVLPSTISIIEALIKMAHKVGKIPQILEDKIKSIYSAENMENIACSPKKKRRSGSLQRLFTGLRRAVQGPSSNEAHEPLLSSFKPKSKRRSSERSDSNTEPDVDVPSIAVKRKSGVLEEGLPGKEDEIAAVSPCVERPRLSAGEKLSPPILPPRNVNHRRSQPGVQFDLLVRTVQPKIMQPSRRDSSVHRRYSLRDRVLSSAGTPKGVTGEAPLKQPPLRRQSLRLAGLSPSPGIYLQKRPYHRRSSDYNTRQGKPESPVLCVGAGTPRLYDLRRIPSAESHVDLVQSTYEAVKLESKNFDATSRHESSHLSQRLSKELKRRSRRSSEYQVRRSPGQRRISNLRRRSKETQTQGTPRQSPSSTDQDGSSSPHSLLRRGKPNTLASGLPLLSKPLHAADFKDCDKHLKLRTRSVSLIVNTSSEPYVNKELSYVVPERAVSPFDLSGVGPPSVGNLLNSRGESSENTLSTSSDASSAGLDEETSWIPARSANLDRFRTPNRPMLDLAQRRMSIDALKRQKKVTDTLKIFNAPGHTPKLICGGLGAGDSTPKTARGSNCHTPAIRSLAGHHSAFRTPRNRMTPLMANSCFQGQSGFTPLPPKPFRPKRLLDDRSKQRTGPAFVPGSNYPR